MSYGSLDAVYYHCAKLVERRKATCACAAGRAIVIVMVMSSLSIKEDRCEKVRLGNENC